MLRARLRGPFTPTTFNEGPAMETYKIIFDSGESEIIEVGSLRCNEHIGKIEVKDENGEIIEEYYLNFDHIAAIIPQ